MEGEHLDTGSDLLMSLFAIGGLSSLAGIIALMGLGMHFLPGYHGAFPFQ
jgi:hypothetical protein